MGNNTSTEIEQLLNDYIRYTSDLKLLLQQEHTALLTKNLDEFSVILDKKSAIITTLATLDDKRASMLSSVDTSQNKKNLETLIHSLPTPITAALLARWQELKTLTTECKKCNEINGMLIHANHEATQLLLGLFKGQTTAANSYGKHGKVCTDKTPSFTSQA